MAQATISAPPNSHPRPQPPAVLWLSLFVRTLRGLSQRQSFTRRIPTPSSPVAKLAASHPTSHSSCTTPPLASFRPTSRCNSFLLDTFSFRYFTRSRLFVLLNLGAWLGCIWDVVQRHAVFGSLEMILCDGVLSIGMEGQERGVQHVIGA